MSDASTKSEPDVSGIFAAIPTPMNERRQLDPKALQHLVEYLCSTELSGFALFTECAEDLLLSQEERRAILKSVASVTERKKALVISVSTPNTLEAQELAKAAEQKGTVAVLISLARYPGIGYRELYRHLERIRKSVPLPILLDTRPGNVLDSLSGEEVATLLTHSGLTGAFVPGFVPGSLDPWKKRFKLEGGRSPTFLTASSLSFLRACEQGASGAICAMAVLAPEQASKIYAAAKSKEPARVSKLENELKPIIEVLGPPIGERSADGLQKITNRLARRSVLGPVLPSVFSPSLIKEALRLQGHPVRSEVRAPLESIRADASERLRTALTMGGLL
ncbi:MAG: dihydrodipicolinate synthase family protein [Deltaproteobacteria bacterium]|nr:dihydrodipicolinate synthase family protein [Deltaproteobacteria bacterium]